MVSFAVIIDEEHFFTPIEKEIFYTKNILIVNDYKFEVPLIKINLFIIVDPSSIEKLEKFVREKHDIPYFIVNKSEKLRVISYSLMLNNMVRTNDFMELTEGLPTDSNLHQCLIFLEDNLWDSGLNLKNVADEVHLSSVHLSRLFSKKLGIGFKKYLISRRLQKAKILLKNGKSVSSTSFEVGFSDLAYFSYVFKKEIGVSPSAFQNQTIDIGG
ncbi:helix-turn-helix transcriptional regulator [Halobacillus sp. B23F22_1]|uniref:helix-turn-helix transcriptional regulator n=1 Tax=Halobacillus sp. B23F22_1 TaxID=3459514 RepID=UPI00373E2EA8